MSIFSVKFNKCKEIAMGEYWIFWLIFFVFAVSLFLCAYPFQRMEAESGKGITVVKNQGKLTSSQYYLLEERVQEFFKMNPLTERIRLIKSCDLTIARVDGKVTDKESLEKVKTVFRNVFL